MFLSEKDYYWHDWYTPSSLFEFNEGRFYGTASILEKKFLNTIFNALEKRFGFKIAIKLPHGLTDYPSDLREALLVAHQLKRAGVINSLKKHEVLSDEPKIFGYEATVCGTEKHSGAEGTGASFFNEAKALWAALGEAVDRYSLHHFSPKKFWDASFERISHKALDIYSLAGLSEERRKRGHPRYPIDFDEKSIFRWVLGYSLTQKRKLWIPLQLATFYNWRQQGEPVLRIPISTGAAAGRNISDALYRGILEVVERDAFMITWLKKLSPPRPNLMGFKNERIQKISEWFSRYNLELHLFALPTDVPCYVMMAVIIDRNPKYAYLTLGLRASLDLEEAIVVAVQEAMSARFFARDFLPMKMEDLPDFSDSEKIRRLERVYIWGSRRDLEPQLDFLWRGEYKAENDLVSLKLNTINDKVSFLMDHFKRNKIEIAYVENIPEEIRGKIPFTCVQVVIPEFQPMHLNESLPYFYGRRLKEVPLKLGYVVDDSINTVPHPFP